MNVLMYIYGVLIQYTTKSVLSRDMVQLDARCMPGAGAISGFLH